MATKTKPPQIEGATAATSAAAKSPPGKSAAKKSSAKKAAAKKAASSRQRPAPRTITVAERQSRIAEAAFLRAESVGFAGNPQDHWVHAEAEVDARLRKSRLKVVD